MAGNQLAFGNHLVVDKLLVMPVCKNFKNNMVPVYFMRELQQVRLNETRKSLSMSRVILNFSSHFNKLLHSSCAVHPLAKFYYPILYRVYDLHQLFVSAKFNLLLGKIVAEGVTHQRAEVRDRFFEDDFKSLRVDTRDHLLKVAATSLVLCEGVRKLKESECIFSIKFISTF
jgi:hypothetical protein